MQILYIGFSNFWVDYSILYLYPPLGANEGSGLVTTLYHYQLVMKKVDNGLTLCEQLS
jgi:hypothetical protein